MKNKLNVALLLDEEALPNWVSYFLEKLLLEKHIKLTLCVIRVKKNTPTDKTSILHTLFDQLDDFLFQPKPYTHTQTKPNELFKLTSKITIAPHVINEEETFSENEILTIRDAQIDVFIQLGFGNLHDDIRALAKYGVWQIYYNDERVNQTEKPGFWAYVNNKFETEIKIEVKTVSNKQNLCIFHSNFRTNRFSPNLNLHNYYWNCSMILYRQIKRLYLSGEINVFENRQLQLKTNNEKHSVKTILRPNSLQVLYAFLIYVKRLSFRVLQRIFFNDSWYLLYHIGNEQKIRLENYKEIKPPKGKFWADPHVLLEGQNYYIFIEELEFHNNKGYLSVIEMDQNGKYQPPVKILETQNHLSYPFIFKFENNYFLIPESEASNKIDLYQCTDFPYQWEYKMTLMDNIQAADSTLFFYKNKWWLFTSIALTGDISGFDEHSYDNELFLFYADDFKTNKWHAHPLNPIVTDVKNSRPAGKVFFENGKIFRPAQDCSVIYGYAINVNEITVLSETNYEEKTISSIKPDGHKSIKGIHTFNQVENLTVIDAFHYRAKYF